MLTFWYINHKKIKRKECIHVTCTVYNYLTTIVKVTTLIRKVEQSTGSSSLSW